MILTYLLSIDTSSIFLEGFLDPHSRRFFSSKYDCLGFELLDRRI